MPFGAYAGELTLLIVRASHRRCGVGRRLVGAVVRHLVDAGLPSVAVECRCANAPARRFYAALGGRPVGEHRVDEAGTQHPSTVYGWTLADVTALLRPIE